MKIKIDQLPIELCEALISVLRDVDPKAQLYWAREKDALKKFLNKKRNFEPLTVSKNCGYQLRETQEITRGVLWRKRLVETDFSNEFTESILKKYPTQSKCLIDSYDINLQLKAAEIFTELGIDTADDLLPLAFHYPQIVSLLARHKNEKQLDAILGYTGSNYFPLILPNGKVGFMSFVSRKPWFKHAGWRGWFMGPEPFFRKGKLLLKASQ